MFSYYIMNCGFLDKKDIFSVYNIVIEKYEEAKNIMAKENFKIKMLSDTNDKESVNKIAINDIDMMSGIEFEEYLGDFFKRQGYAVDFTPKTNDKGIDIILKKGSARIGIQAKCYGSPVGISAVQEAIGGKAFYKLDRIMVIANNAFTPSAVDLARSNDVVLWDRTILMSKL